MGTNVLAPFGFRPVRNLYAAAPTYQANRYRIEDGYATAIGFGDVVMTGNAGSGNQGYVTLATTSAGRILGIFAGCLPFYDQTFTQVVNQAGWPGTNNTPGDVDCWIIDDPQCVFQVQMSGTWSEAYRGQNINFASNGAAGAAPGYISTAYVDATTISTDGALPFRILGQAQNITGGPLDPANTNPVIEVTMNVAEIRSSLGV